MASTGGAGSIQKQITAPSSSARKAGQDIRFADKKPMTVVAGKQKAANTKSPALHAAEALENQALNAVNRTNQLLSAQRGTQRLVNLRGKPLAASSVDTIVKGDPHFVRGLVTTAVNFAETAGGTLLPFSAIAPVLEKHAALRRGIAGAAITLLAVPVLREMIHNDDERTEVRKDNALRRLQAQTHRTPSQHTNKAVGEVVKSNLHVIDAHLGAILNLAGASAYIANAYPSIIGTALSLASVGSAAGSKALITNRLTDLEGTRLNLPGGPIFNPGSLDADIAKASAEKISEAMGGWGRGLKGLSMACAVSASIGVFVSALELFGKVGSAEASYDFSGLNRTDSESLKESQSEAKTDFSASRAYPAAVCLLLMARYLIAIAQESYSAPKKKSQANAAIQRDDLAQEEHEVTVRLEEYADALRRLRDTAVHRVAIEDQEAAMATAPAQHVARLPIAIEEDASEEDLQDRFKPVN
jgi:hypothetical protein